MMLKPLLTLCFTLDMSYGFMAKLNLGIMHGLFVSDEFNVLIDDFISSEGLHFDHDFIPQFQPVKNRPGLKVRRKINWLLYEDDKRVSDSTRKKLMSLLRTISVSMKDGIDDQGEIPNIAFYVEQTRKKWEQDEVPEIEVTLQALEGLKVWSDQVWHIIHANQFNEELKSFEGILSPPMLARFAALHFNFLPLTNKGHKPTDVRLLVLKNQLKDALHIRSRLPNVDPDVIKEKAQVEKNFLLIDFGKIETHLLEYCRYAALHGLQIDQDMRNHLGQTLSEYAHFIDDSFTAAYPVTYIEESEKHFGKNTMLKNANQVANRKHEILERLRSFAEGEMMKNFSENVQLVDLAI